MALAELASRSALATEWVSIHDTREMYPTQKFQVVG